MAKSDFTANLSKARVIGSAGFGVPLIIQGKANAAKDYAEYDSLDAVLEAGFTSDTPVYKQCAKLFIQEDCPSKVAICVGTGKITETLNLIKAQDFRQIIPLFGSDDDTLKELATYIEATDDRMLFVKVADSSSLESIGKMDRTLAIVYAGAEEGVEGALVGATAGYDAGSFTYKNIILKGIEPDPLTDAQIEAIHKAGGICIVQKAGDIVTSEGTVLSGEYADIIDSKDYVIRNITYKAQKLANNSKKLAYDNTGISQLEAVVTNALREAFLSGIIAQDGDGQPMYSTDFATREETSAADRAARTYKGGKFSFDLAGAIHYATINGTIEV